MIYFLLLVNLYEGAIVGFTRPPLSTSHVYLGETAYLDWGYNSTEALFRVRYGTVDEETNVMNKILVSVTKGKVLLTAPEKVGFTNGVLMIHSVNYTDQLIYRCELNYQTQTFSNDTALAIIDTQFLNATISNNQPIEWLPIVMNVTVQSVNVPLVTWYAGQIKTKQGVTVQETVTGVWQLTLNSKAERNLDTYIVKLSFPGLDEKLLYSYKVDVLYSAGNSTIFTKNITTEIVLVNSTNVLLQCHAYANPPLTYVISRSNGEVVSNDSFGRVVLDSSKGYGNEDTYTCLAENMAGKGVLKVISVVYGEAPVILNHTTDELTVAAGQPLQIYFNISSKPKANFSFLFQNTSPVNYFTDDVMKLNGVIFSMVKVDIDELTPQHLGSYGFLAQNQLGETKADVFLNVTYDLQFSASATSPNSPLTFILGMAASLSCSTTVNPGSIGYTWSRDNRSIDVYDKEISFEKVKVGDGGVYTCHVRSGASALNRTFKVHVASIPSIYFYKEQLTPNIGDNTTLVCLATGLPTPQVTWYINGLSDWLSRGNNLSLDTRAYGKGVFTFNCTANNVHGSDSRLVKVTITQATSSIISEHEEILYVFVGFVCFVVFVLLLALVTFICRKRKLAKKKEAAQSSIFSHPVVREDALTVNPMFIPSNALLTTSTYAHTTRNKSPLFDDNYFSNPHVFESGDTEEVSLEIIFADDSKSPKEHLTILDNLVSRLNEESRSDATLQPGDELQGSGDELQGSGDELRGSGNELQESGDKLHEGSEDELNESVDEPTYEHIESIQINKNKFSSVSKGNLFDIKLEKHTEGKTLELNKQRDKMDIDFR